MAGVAALTLVACGGSDKSVQDVAEDQIEAGAASDEISSGAEQKAAFEKRAANNLAASNKFLEDNAKKKDVKVTDTGLQYMVLEEGPESGVTPVSTDLVVFEYVSTKTDGVEFDSSRARGAAAMVRVSDLHQEMPGLTEGLQLMKEGAKYRFFIPPDLAYGDRGVPGGPIDSNEALIFDVELIKVQNPERNLEAAMDFLAANAEKDGVKTTESGLQYQVITEGGAGGKSPEEADTVKVHYQGTLLNGTEFDSSYARGEPIEFPLNGVIAGWTEGVQLMSEGDKYRFFIPPDLGYGERGTPGGPIGPNEALIFEIELIEVK